MDNLHQAAPQAGTVLDDAPTARVRDAKILVTAECVSCGEDILQEGTGWHHIRPPTGMAEALASASTGNAALDTDRKQITGSAWVPGKGDVRYPEMTEADHQAVLARLRREQVLQEAMDRDFDLARRRRRG